MSRRNPSYRVMYALTECAYIRNARGGAVHAPRHTCRDRPHRGVRAHPHRLRRLRWRGRGRRRRADAHRLGHGHRGREARRGRRRLQEVPPEHHRQGDPGRLGRGAPEARRGGRRGQAARRHADGRDLPRRVRRHGRPRAGRHPDRQEGRLLPRRLGAGLVRRRDVRRPLVRRHPRPLLPHRPRPQGRCRQAARHHGRAAEGRPGPPGQGEDQVGPVHPAGRPGHGAELLPVPVLHAAARSSTRAARPPSTAPRRSRRWRPTASSSPRASARRRSGPATT